MISSLQAYARVRIPEQINTLSINKTTWDLNIMTDVTWAINFIRYRGINHIQFKANSKVNFVILCSTLEVHWCSKGKFLQLFYLNLKKSSIPL
jgi:hypothetical protein